MSNTKERHCEKAKEKQYITQRFVEQRGSRFRIITLYNTRTGRGVEEKET